MASVCAMKSGVSAAKTSIARGGVNSEQLGPRITWRLLTHISGLGRLKGWAQLELKRETQHGISACALGHSQRGRWALRRCAGTGAYTKGVPGEKGGSSMAIEYPAWE